MKQQRCLLCGQESPTGLHVMGCLLCFSCERKLLDSSSMRMMPRKKRRNLLRLYGTRTVEAANR